ncbi:D-alanyl-D-alanine carboxypeptidase [Modicisalibacter radicis]|uniref:D-alanyl-D-alanine carboxypeptidase n=1 Tax=Halomonas sp. EAR18 TaxID=2518972 RepID=UPI00109D1D0B|nr:D-alanyl-D-alanine carboxypeptidase [Halomonas sp. EAR18]
MPFIQFSAVWRRGAGAVLVAVCIAAIGWSSTVSAGTNPRYAGIVVDVASGEVLYNDRADEPRYPASLTKMMTLYLLFEAIERGSLTLDDTLSVSAHAAAQPPTKLWLEAGERLPVETAILALIVRSANDVAAVVAEGLAGSEPAFARQMTDKARALGMRETTFRNASGLPDEVQVTTARDMARLALHLMQDFPGYYDYFASTQFAYRGKIYRGHNRVLTRYPGADGLKTGFIRASGFNIATSAVHDGRRIVSVVMGGFTAQSRDDHVIDLLDRGFARAALMDRGDWVAKTAIFDNEPAVVAHPAQPADEDPIGQLIAGLDRQDAGTVGWAVQVGAFSDSSQARALASRAAGYVDAAGAAPSVSVTPTENGQPLFRARVIDLQENQARQSCRNLQQQGIDCVVVAGVGG